MPIEFFCPGCGKRMRTAEKTAGRKGKCPQCGTKVQIPNESLASDSEIQPLKPEDLQIACGQCLAPLRFPAGSEGMQGNCPHCRNPVAIPHENRQRWRTTSKIHFHCPSCQGLVKAAKAAAGKRGECPECKHIFQIPAQ